MFLWWVVIVNQTKKETLIMTKRLLIFSVGLWSFDYRFGNLVWKIWKKLWKTLPNVSHIGNRVVVPFARNDSGFWTVWKMKILKHWNSLNIEVFVQTGHFLRVDLFLRLQEYLQSKSLYIRNWALGWFYAGSLVTQPMMQRQPNPTELRSMDSYIQILCRFQKH